MNCERNATRHQSIALCDSNVGFTARRPANSERSGAKPSWTGDTVLVMAYTTRSGGVQHEGTAAVNTSQYEAGSAEHAMDDALALLKNDHREVENLFQSYENANAEQNALALKICLALEVHAQIEEEIFYPAVRNAITNSDLISEAIAEHASVKQLVAQIEKALSEPGRLSSLLAELRQQVMHHVQEEENELFPEVEASGLDLQDLGQRLAQRKMALMHQLGARA
jgi:hemerythrin superfamily protein